MVAIIDEWMIDFFWMSIRNFFSLKSNNIYWDSNKMNDGREEGIRDISKLNRMWNIKGDEWMSIKLILKSLRKCTYYYES